MVFGLFLNTEEHQHMANLPENFFDMTKYLKDFDPTKMVDEFSKSMKGMNLPGVDMDTIVAGQKKNLEALTTANRVAYEGMQAIAKRQAEIFQETMNEARSAMDDIMKEPSPPQVAAKQADLAKNAVEKALSNMRELAEMVTKANEEVTDTMKSRITESLDEIKEAALKLKQS
jgi:phasin family protein